MQSRSALIEIHQTAGDPSATEVRRSGRIGFRGEPRAISAYPITLKANATLSAGRSPPKRNVRNSAGTAIVTRRAETPKAARGAKRLEPVSAGAQRRRMPPDGCHQSQDRLLRILW